MNVRPRRRSTFRPEPCRAIGQHRASIRRVRVSRTIQSARAGGPDVLEYLESAAPHPGAHEVCVRVAAIGIDRTESSWRSDAHVEPVTFPAGLGCLEEAGIVDAIAPRMLMSITQCISSGFASSKVL